MYGHFTVVLMPGCWTPIYPRHETCQRAGISVDEDNKRIIVVGRRYGLQFITAFGARIRKLIIDCGEMTVDFADEGIDQEILQAKYDMWQKTIHNSCSRGELVRIKFFAPELFPINPRYEFGSFDSVQDVHLSCGM